MSVSPSDQGHHFAPPPMLDDDVEDFDLDVDSYSDTDELADVDGPDPSDYDDTDSPRRPPALLDDPKPKRRLSIVKGAPEPDEDDPDFSDELPGVPLTDEHRVYLMAQGITAAYLDSDIAQRQIRSITSRDQLPKQRRAKLDPDFPPTAIMFAFTYPAADRPQWQLRPDHPITNTDGRAVKYTSAAASGSLVGIVSESPNVVPRSKTVIIAEGTKQARALASALRHDPSYVIVCITGCANWSRGANLHPAIVTAIKDAQTIVVIPDADAATNPNVAKAIWELRDALYRRKQHKNGSILFVRLPGAGKEGIDDLLADVDETDRAEYVLSLIADAVPTPTDKRPTSRRQSARADEDVDGDTLFDRYNGGLQVANCVDAIRARHTLAIGELDKRLYTADDNGIFTRTEEAAGRENHLVTDFLTEALGNDFRVEFVKQVLVALESSLRKSHDVIPEVPTHGLLAVRNGMVDPVTGELHPHDPKYLVTFRLDVDYDPDATAPEFEQWGRAITDLGDRDQFDILLDATSALIDTMIGRAPDRGLYLQGKTRSGKGTYMQGLLGKMIPEMYRSSLSLLDMAEKKDAKLLTLHGKIANLSGETPEAYIADASIFKMMLGMDQITVDQKYKTALPFYNRAFPIFTANDMPHISDTSGAVEARLSIVMFPHSNAGKEDRLLLGRLQQELPGILNLILDAWRARRDRDWQYLPSDPAAKDLFVSETNPVAEFVGECLELPPASAWRGTKTIDPEWGIGKMELHAIYVAFVKTAGGKSKTRKNFLKDLSRPPFNVVIDALSPTKTAVVACRIRDDAPVELPQGITPRRASSAVVDDAPPPLNPPV
ncbi:phage/plasmid primase, P4 family [Mycobacteroides abscessus]|uniref:phage/plasmid primase, P4 family n=1 Tax=Mycobacteroides abscessus TaxID=36809 RepID=UPI000C25F8A8|nr:phage/plasmid primase, P4 family [Mycobacteroides abscessus]